MGQAFSNACFTKNELDFGNRVIFVSSMLLNASMQTKVNILNATKETGELTKNERRELLGYATVEGGDDVQISLNYVKGNDQSKYQTGEEDKKEDTDGQDKTD
jgi:hypothetical protein